MEYINRQKGYIFDSIKVNKRSDFWSMFDAIFCINLITRDDKLNSSYELFKKFNIPVRYYRTYKNNNSIEGCFNSHADVISYCNKMGYKTVLVFEDDVTFENLPCKKIQDEITSFMKNRSSIFLNLGPALIHTREIVNIDYK